MANELKEVQRLKAIRKKDNVVATNGNIIDSLASNSPNDAPSIRVINDILKTKSNENHSHTKSQIGLENVDNTSDNNKPVSAIQREAIEESLSNANSYTDRTIDNLKKGALKTLEEDVANLKTSKAEDNHTHSKADINDMPTKLSQFTNDKTYTTLAEVQNLVAALVDSAPSTLDTLKEVAEALGNDPNFATTIMGKLGEKANTINVYTKEETNTMINAKQNRVLFGTTSPSNDLGVDGDIYIQIEE